MDYQLTFTTTPAKSMALWPYAFTNIYKMMTESDVARLIKVEW